MATVERLETQSELSVPTGNLDNLERFVQDATWKDLLFELVHKNKLDPWNVDIIQLVEKYVEAVKAMRVLDLRVPANIILSAAILVRLKSDMLRLQEEVQVEGDEIIVQRAPVDVEPLSFRLRLPPKNIISLAELVTALEEAMKIKEIRETRKLDIPIDIPIMLTRIDVEAEMENLYVQIKKNVDSSRMITFNSLTRALGDYDALLNIFIPLLFLAHKNRVTLVQEKFFSEIIIALNN